MSDQVAKQKVHIFLGKGGVGKSTCSALEAVSILSTNSKVLLNSMDPAHNLHDIFECKLCKNEKKVFGTLYVAESDIEAKSKEYIKSVQNTLKNVYHYQQSLNLEHYFSILKYAPGTEEYASLLVLEDCLDKKKYDAIIVDTPPTALTLKTLALPQVNLHWINSLAQMRQEIVDKTNGVKKIRKENLRTLEEDSVYQRLQFMKARYEKIQAQLQDDSKTEFVLIMNEDELSLSESKLIKKQMEELGFKIHRIIINKSGMYVRNSTSNGKNSADIDKTISTNREEWREKVKVVFPESVVQLLPMQEYPITGESMLKDCCVRFTD
ncbi:MAG: hypothetical protein BKP49_07920 [Treponema sp. CETP13]|nr:MAG: hypothetical protein BKP49_07920 [Treponema sp. CETP13]